MNPDDRLSLANLARGAAIERFDDELHRVLENILDPNTRPGVRTVTLKVEIKPAEDLKTAAIQVLCNSKVQGARPVPTMIFLGKIRGEAVAREPDTAQTAFDFASKTPVVPIRGAGEPGKEE